MDYEAYSDEWEKISSTLAVEAKELLRELAWLGKASFRHPLRATVGAMVGGPAALAYPAALLAGPAAYTAAGVAAYKKLKKGKTKKASLSRVRTGIRPLRVAKLLNAKAIRKAQAKTRKGKLIFRG